MGIPSTHRTTDSIDAFVDDAPFPDHDSEYGSRRRLDITINRKSELPDPLFKEKPVKLSHPIFKERPVELSHPTFKEKPIWLSPHELDVVVALRNFHAVEPGDLSFTEKDIITVTSKGDSAFDWWTGKVNGREGSFPANYVELV
ncbi:SH3 domain-containing protein [Scleroderma yunnanense]